MAFEPNKVTSGISMDLAFSSKNVIEDFLKLEYQEGLRNEFSTMEALINKLSKDTISGKKKYKAFALGITDNVRAMGRSADRYELGFDQFWNKGVETVEAEFDTVKLMATFAVTDEAILKGTGDGSLLDVVKDSLDRMQLNIKHTLQRFTYGSFQGLIGAITQKVDATNFLALQSIVGSGTTPNYARGGEHNAFYGNAGTVRVFKFKMSNSHSVLPGMGLMVEQKAVVPAAPFASTTTATEFRIIGRIWQKANAGIHEEVVILFADKIIQRTATFTSGASVPTFGAWSAVASPTSFTSLQGSTKVYSRQIDDEGAVQPEYHGLHDILVDNESVLFGVDRGVYSSLVSTKWDLGGTQYLTEEILRDMSDHIMLTSPEATGINLVASTHRIISSVERALYQFKQYSLDSAGSGFQLGGRADIKFDNFTLVKDKYARDNNVYMLDTTKVGELVRRDFTWITNGEKEGVLQRRPGTELYEGIMNKYADMYIDAWKAHAIILNAKTPGVGENVTWDQGTVKVANTAANPLFTVEVVE
jgi:hypothetical protein